MKTPKIDINGAMSINGKMLSHLNEKGILTSATDRQNMDEIRSQYDIILIGANTIRKDNPSFIIKDDHLVDQRVKKGLSKQPAVACVSESLNIPETSRFIQERTTNGEDNTRFIYSPVPLDQSPLPASISSLVRRVDGDRKDFLEKVIHHLAEQGFFRILCEGGGHVFSQVLGHKLVKNIFITLMPVVLSYSFSDLFPQTFYDIPLDLKSSHSQGNELYLHYEVLA